MSTVNVMMPLSPQKDSIWATPPLDKAFYATGLAIKLRVARASLGDAAVEKILCGQDEVLAVSIPLRALANPEGALRALLTEEERSAREEGLPIEREKALLQEIDATPGFVFDCAINLGVIPQGKALELHFDPAAFSYVENVAVVGYVRRDEIPSKTALIGAPRPTMTMLVERLTAAVERMTKLVEEQIGAMAKLAGVVSSQEERIRQLEGKTIEVRVSHTEGKIEERP